MKAVFVQSGLRARSWLMSCCSDALATRRQVGCIRAGSNYSILGAGRKETWVTEGSQIFSWPRVGFRGALLEPRYHVHRKRDGRYGGKYLVEES